MHCSGGGAPVRLVRCTALAEEVLLLVHCTALVEEVRLPVRCTAPVEEVRLLVHCTALLVRGGGRLGWCAAPSDMLV